MVDVWRVQPGQIEHRANPGFTAKWSSDRESFENLDEACWSGEGSNEDDTIHLYAFKWTQAVPAPENFDRLMTEAVAAIDRWINRQM